MRGILDEMQMEELLKAQFIGRIGCHIKGKTYVVPINYFYDGEFIYCHTHEGLKIEIMRENPKICFETDTMENSETWKSVIAWGNYEELTDNEDRTKAFQLLLSRPFPFMISKALKTELGSNYPFLPDSVGSIGGVVFRVRLEAKTGRFDQYDTVIELPVG
jgi:hypothetical protein